MKILYHYNQETNVGMTIINEKLKIFLANKRCVYMTLGYKLSYVFFLFCYVLS